MGRVARCAVCEERPVSRALGVCRKCIVAGREAVRPLAEAAHVRARASFGLPGAPPAHSGGARCVVCARECTMAPGERGYCGLRRGEAGPRGVRVRSLAGTPARGLLEWYRDPLPTNGVADWVCAGHAAVGRHNLAVFYAACSLDCLFCQNWHFRRADRLRSRTVSAEELASAAREDTFCVCFFGGDPAPQMPHALAAARRLAARGVRICWETAGLAHPRLMDRAVELSLATGGIVKFDLKAADPALHAALTGAPNRRTWENLERAAARARERTWPPLVVASTPLVPGYVTPEEVGAIARRLAAIDRGIPYALLAFAPRFRMADLPPTSRRHAEEALAAARAAGLLEVRLGNVHLLAEA